MTAEKGKYHIDKNCPTTIPRLTSKFLSTPMAKRNLSKGSHLKLLRLVIRVLEF